MAAFLANSSLPEGLPVLTAYRGFPLVVKALDTSISRRVASLTLTLKYPQNTYAELRPQGFNPGCCRQHRGFELATVVLMLVERLMFFRRQLWVERSEGSGFSRCLSCF
jgi:hypothetical protein